MTRDAFERAWPELRPKLLKFAMHLTRGRRESSEDLVQCAALRLVPRLEEIDGQRLGSYAHQVVANLFRDHMRQLRRRATEVSIEDHVLGLAAADQTYVDSVLPDELEEALRSLRDPRVICMIAEGRSYPEIADAVGIPIGTVRSRVHRDRAQLIKALARPSTETEPSGKAPVADLPGIRLSHSGQGWKLEFEGWAAQVNQ